MHVSNFFTYYYALHSIFTLTFLFFVNLLKIIKWVLELFDFIITVVFGNKEENLVVEGDVIHLQTSCVKPGKRTMSKQRRFLFVLWELGGRGLIDKG